MKYILIAAVSLIFLFVIVLVSSSQLQEVKFEVIKPGETQGMGVVVRGKEYTLNFNQQNALIEAVNDMIPAIPSKGDPLFFEKVIIYRFHEPVWTLTAVKGEEKDFYTIHSINKDVTLSTDNHVFIDSILRDASAG